MAANAELTLNGYAARMSDNGQPDASTEAVETLLRAELAHGNGVIASTGPIVRHLLLNDDNTLFSDEVLAHIRGMIVNIARQLLYAAAEDEDAARDAFFDQRANAVAGVLLDDTAFLSHIHALAIEAQFSERLSRRDGIDPVRSPLLQELAASSDAELAAAAMRALAAQARFVQQQRRMELALTELPEDLFETALDALGQCLVRDREMAAKAVKLLHDGYDPAQCRTQQLAMLVDSMERDAGQVLESNFEIDRAGIAVFVTALAVATGQSREIVTFALSEKHSTRLALGLRATGLDAGVVEDQMLLLHPNTLSPEGLDKISPERARALLAQTPPAMGA